MKKATELQAKYYNERHRMIGVQVGDVVLLNTVNLWPKGVSGKLRKKYIGSFRITNRIGIQSCTLELTTD